MKYLKIAIFSALSLLMMNCASGLTQEEMERQHQADTSVSGLLFENGLEEKASYNVRKDSSVKILFDKTVGWAEYTMIVNKLREDKHISSVYAEQDGAEVCPLR